ncbi:uncharacterized protein [Procambarus clarkii]|uniref:uncharacterized protein n=1 Tax=Procambarus clarkii TaxID=6728 RepID=UPI003743CCB9
MTLLSLPHHAALLHDDHNHTVTSSGSTRSSHRHLMGNHRVHRACRPPIRTNNVEQSVGRIGKQKNPSYPPWLPIFISTMLIRRQMNGGGWEDPQDYSPPEIFRTVPSRPSDGDTKSDLFGILIKQALLQGADAAGVGIAARATSTREKKSKM